jgi:hypothetical protein
VLQLTDTARDAMDTFLHPPLPRHRRPWWWMTTRAAIAILPAAAIRMYGLSHLPLVDAGIRPLLAAGSRWTKRHGKPPPVLREARARERRRVAASTES